MKINKSALLFVLFISFSATKVLAQYYSFASGQPVKESTYAEVAGTPYLSDNWSTGSVIFGEGKTTPNVSLKYNIKDDIIYYKGPNGETMNFKDPVKAFSIIEGDKTHIYQSGYPSYGTTTDKSYFEVLAPGKLQYLSKKSKSIAEEKSYPSGVSEKRFLDITRYYIFSAGKLEIVKKDKKSILTAIGNKQPELEAYIKTNNLNLKNDDDLSKLVIYYNSL